jgi:hypothetical protein
MPARTLKQKAAKVIYAARRRDRRKHLLNVYKMKKGCAICGYNRHGCALDFDHVDASNKVAAVSRLTLGSIKKLFLEIRKCQVLCKNCHSVKSYTQERERHASTNV